MYSQDEPGEVEGIVVHSEATTIAEDLEKETTRHSSIVRPSSVLPKESSLSYEEESKDDEVC